MFDFPTLTETFSERIAREVAQDRALAERSLGKEDVSRAQLRAVKALLDYGMSGSIQLNQALRAGRPLTSKTRHLMASIEQFMDPAIGASVLEHRPLWRGMALTAQQLDRGAWADAAFISVSRSRIAAERFAATTHLRYEECAGQKLVPVLLRIACCEVAGADLAQVARAHRKIVNDGHMRQINDEAEIILQRGSEFAIADEERVRGAGGESMRQLTVMVCAPS